jgi:hypothetical protein
MAELRSHANRNSAIAAAAIAVWKPLSPYDPAAISATPTKATTTPAR